MKSESRLRAFVRLAAVGLFFFLAALWAVAAPAPAGAADFERDKAMEKKLSKALSTPVTVHNTDWFVIIASRTYAKQVENELVPNVVEAVAEFCQLVDHDPRKQLWDGEKGRLVLLKSRKAYRKYIDYFEKEARPERLNPDFTEAVQEVQSFSWLEPMPYAVCCGEGMQFEEANQHLFHLLGQALLTRYEYNYTFAPAWLHEGYGIHMAMRYAGGNILFLTEGLNNALFGTGVFSGLSAWARSENWPGFFRDPDQRRDMPTLVQLSQTPLEAFSHRTAALSWSFVSFLLDRRADDFRTYIQLLKTQAPAEREGDYWTPLDFSLKSFEKAFGCGFEALQAEWGVWADGEYTSKGKGSTARNAKNRRAGSVRFVPDRHLEGFSAFENEPRAEAARAAFFKREGDWVSPDELETLRADWQSAWERLMAEIARAAEGDRLKEIPGIAQLLEKACADPYSKLLTEEKVLSLLRTGGPILTFHGVTRYLIERYGCAGALHRLQHCPHAEGVFEDPEAAAVIALLEAAAGLETGVLTNLSAMGGEIRVSCWPRPLILESVNQGMLVLAEIREEDQVFDAAAPADPDCTVTELEDRLRIECPSSRFSVEDFLNQCRDTLNMTSEEDGLLLSLIPLFRVNEARFQDVLGEAMGSQEGETRSRLFKGLQAAEDMAGLIAFLGWPGRYSLEEAKALTQGLAERLARNSVYVRQKRRVQGLLKRSHLAHYLPENRYLRQFKGFKGVEGGTGKVLFQYTFADPTEIEDFQKEEKHPFAERLRARYKVSEHQAAQPFHIQDERLSCRGIDFKALEPVFTGELDLSLTLQVARDEGGDWGEPFYLLFGYGLNEQGGYLGASCLTYLESRHSDKESAQMQKATEEVVSLADAKDYRVRLKGTADQVDYELAGFFSKTFAMQGIRPGRVFFWVYGSRWFRIDDVEIKGEIDPEWLVQAILN